MKTSSEIISSRSKSRAGLAFSTLCGALILASVSIGCSQGAADKNSETDATPDVALAPMTNLEDQLSVNREKSNASAPPEILLIGERQRQALRESGILESALNVGDKAPEFELLNAVGKMIKSSDILARGPMVLTFYRGGWCPYCNLQLKHLQESLAHFEAAGISLVAVSPQTPDNSISIVEKHKLEFEVLSDSGNELARQFGVAYQITPELDSLVQTFGLNLRELNETENAELPLAVTYGINIDGVIKYAFVDVDYSKRAEPADILAALQSVKSGL